MTVRGLVLLTLFLLAAASGVYCFAASPSATLTVTISPSGGGGIAAAVGPNYSGSVPAPAQAAGFTTLAANYEFSNTSNFTTNGHTYNFSDITTWLDCKGAANPLWWNATFSGGNTTPCSDFSMVNDGGTNAMQMTFTQTDHSNQGSGGADNTTMQTTQPNSGSGTTSLPTGFAFPEEFYAEFKVRMVTPDSNAPGSLLGDWWSISATPNSPYMEDDFQETFSGGNDGTGTNQGLTFFPEAHFVNSGNLPGYNHNNYNVVGERVTTDSSGNASICFYVNGTQIAGNAQSGWTRAGNCVTGRWPDTSALQELLRLEVTAAAVAPGATMNGPVTINTQYFRLFTCAGWNTGSAAGGYNCAGPPLSSNP